MPQVEVETRDATNTTGTTAVADAFDVLWQEQRNGLGKGSFRIPNGVTPPAKHTIMRGRAGERRFPWVVEHIDPTLVSVSDEKVEATLVSGRGLGVEWAQSRVKMPPTLSNLAETVPVLDERVMGWMGPDFDHTAAGFVPANFIAVQGWESAFYTGLPSGWWDGAAQWVGPHSGDDDDAPEGINLYIEWVLVGEGNVVLEFAGDNWVTGWFNGVKMGTGSFRNRVVREFECTTAGWALLAFEVENAADDGPPGGNPTALIYTLHAGTSNPFDVFARSSSDTTYLLEYPSTIPEVPVGRQILQVMYDNALMDDWTVAGTETHDTNGVEYPATGVVSYRIGSDSCWDVISSLCQTVIDVTIDAAGKTLRPYVKGTAGDASSLLLFTGYEGEDEDDVNVVDLEWDTPGESFDALMVRWQRGRFLRGSGDRCENLDLGGIPDLAAAEAIADGVLDAGEPVTASFELVGVDVDDLPALHDTIDVPGPLTVDARTEQVVTAVTISGDDDGDAEMVVEVGSLAEDRVTLLKRASSRGAAAVGGVAAAASIALPDPVQVSHGGDSEWPLFCTGSWPMGTGVMSGITNPPRVGILSTLRLTAQAGTGSSVVDVLRNGVSIATFSFSSSAAYEVEVVDLLVLTSDEFEVDVDTDGGHTFVAIHGSLTGLGR